MTVRTLPRRLPTRARWRGRWWDVSPAPWPSVAFLGAPGRVVLVFWLRDGRRLGCAGSVRTDGMSANELHAELEQVLWPTG